jgi:lysophospholipase L1-like esterase
MRARSGFIHFLQQVGVSVLAVLVAVLSLELTVRIVQRLSPPERTETRSVDFITCDQDSLLGWIFPASSRGFFRTGPHPTPLETNELGLRNPPIDVGREPCLRILVLGDSYAFGWGVQQNEAFPRQLEAMIVERYPGVSVEVLNAGVPGYGLYQQRAMLERLLSHVELDIVVSTFSLANDPADDLRILRFAPDRLTDYSPELSRRNPVLAWVVRKSALARFVDRRTSAIRFKIANSSGEAVDAATTCMSELLSTCAEHDLRVLQVSIPHRSQIARGWKARLVTSLSKRASDMQNRVAEQHGVRTVDAMEAMLVIEDSAEAYLLNDPHWAPDGHRAVAEAVLDALPEEWLRTPD